MMEWEGSNFQGEMLLCMVDVWSVLMLEFRSETSLTLLSIGLEYKKILRVRVEGGYHR